MTNEWSSCLLDLFPTSLVSSPGRAGSVLAIVPRLWAGEVGVIVFRGRGRRTFVPPVGLNVAPLWGTRRGQMLTSYCLH